MAMVEKISELDGFDHPYFSFVRDAFPRAVWLIFGTRKDTVEELADYLGARFDTFKYNPNNDIADEHLFHAVTYDLLEGEE